MIKANALRHAAELGLILVAPDTSPRGLGLPGEEDDWDFGTGAGFYLDAEAAPWRRNYRMYSYVTKELPALIEAKFPADSGRRGVFGHSMGGHGALVLGLRNPARFTAISAFAPILNPMQVPWGVKAFTTYLGADTNAWKSWDATELIKETTSLPILITQGSKDGFYEKQLKETTFLKNAEEARNNIQYQMKEGYDHSYFFISTFLEEHFAFHLSHL